MRKKNTEEYPSEYMEAIVSIYRYTDNPKSIHSMLVDLYPNEDVPNTREIRTIIKQQFGDNVESSAGAGKTFVTAMVCDEVAKFLDEIPTYRSRSDAINTILLWYIREYNLRMQKLEEERKQRLKQLLDYTERFSETHHIPIDEDADPL